MQDIVRENEIYEEKGKITKPMKVFYQNLKLTQVYRKLKIT